MSLIKSVTLTPAKLAANRANARRSTGPRTPQGQQRELARVARVCEWWDADQWWYADEATYAAFAGDATNPQCPLESTDRNSEASLFPFQWLRSASPSELRRIGKAMAKRVLRFADHFYSMRCTNEPTMSFRINILAFRIPLYSRFEAVAGPGSEDVEVDKAEPTNPQCPLESTT